MQTGISPISVAVVAAQSFLAVHFFRDIGLIPFVQPDALQGFEEDGAVDIVEFVLAGEPFEWEADGKGRWDHGS